MSSDFRLHYDRLRENDPTKPKNGANAMDTFYDAPDSVRHLCLVWPDGKQQFLSYAYLVGGTFTPGEELNEITLNFSAYLVSLKGYCLESLFVALLDHLPKQVTQIQQRYAATETSAVTDILVQPIK